MKNLIPIHAGACFRAGLQLMRNRITRNVSTNLRWSATLMLATALLAGTACMVKKSVAVEKVLTPLSNAGTSELITLVNNLAGVQSLRGKIDIEFDDLSSATSGIAEKYHRSDGTITLQRPGRVYLVVQVPLIASDVTQMTSDGQHFRIAILKGEEKYRRFVRGTNDAVYAKLDAENGTTGKTGKAKSEVQAVKALSNLRPQHLTDALLIRAIDTRVQGLWYAQSEFFQSEKDLTPGASSNKRVVRGYYLLDELQPGTGGSARLLRRFWFDRVNGIHLARQQNFNDQGALVTDVTYGELRQFGTEGNVQLPVRVSLTRPQDNYRVTVTYQAPESVTLNRDYPVEAFVLENKWGLPEVDLDAKKPNP